MLRGLSIVVAVLASAACGGGSDGAEGGKRLVVYVNAPFSGSSYIGETIARGAELGAREVNDQGLNVGGESYVLEIERLDSRLSPRAAVANVRRAAQDDEAVAVVDEGTGVDASWRTAAESDLPLGVVFQGGAGLVDEEERPNVFRIAPTDHGLGYRLAEYLIPKGRKLALLVDDSGYGQQGKETLEQAFSGQDLVVARIGLPATATDVAPQVLRARRAGAESLLVWARPPVIAAVITAARSSGWNVPVYTPPAGADPLVRQELADNPEWLDGVVFASGRMTAEGGSAHFYAFVRTFESAFGPQLVGVRTPDGADVVQPPDYAMYSFDFVRLLGAALAQARTTRGAAVLDALNEVTIIGANGDERGFNVLNHEGVIDDDVYFAEFDGMVFRPVADDPLSASLPLVEQTR